MVKSEEPASTRPSPCGRHLSKSKKGRLMPTLIEDRDVALKNAGDIVNGAKAASVN